MCTDEQIKDVDSGKSVIVKKKIAYSFIFGVGIFFIGWLVSVIMWVAGTDTAIAQNVEDIKSNKTEITKIENWKIEHTDNQDELIYNMRRLLESNGLEWKSFKR